MRLDTLYIARKLGSDWRRIRPRFDTNGIETLAFDGVKRNGSIIISIGTYDDEEWVHSSISHPNSLPSYTELKQLYLAVYQNKWAYQVFAPQDEHVSIHDYALHLWGRLDGKPVLPDFSRFRISGVREV